MGGAVRKVHEQHLSHVAICCLAADGGLLHVPRRPQTGADGVTDETGLAGVADGIDLRDLALQCG